MDFATLTELQQNPPKRGAKKSSFDSTYEKIEVLGKGNFGTAWLVAKQGKPNTKYVAKEISFFDGADGKFAKSSADIAANEIRILRRVSHPNLIKYIKSFEESDRVVIVMEHGGQDLNQLLKSKLARKERFEESKLWLWVAQIMLGLHYLHGSRMLHRDMKPANIFVSEDLDGIKIGDFGMSKVLVGNDEHAHTMCGTPQYFSPEMVLGKPFTSKADMWACGVLLYELMTGSKPFVSRNRMELFERITRLDFTPLDPKSCGYSAELCEVVRALLVVDPDCRLSAKEILRFPSAQRSLVRMSESKKFNVSDDTLAAFTSQGTSGGASFGDEGDIVEWISSHFSGPRQEQILELIKRAQSPLSLGEQCDIFDSVMEAMGSDITPSIHMELLRLLFNGHE